MVKSFSKVQVAVVAALAVAIVGVLLALTHAASTPVSSEAESGTITGNAHSITDSTASGSAAIKFGGVATTTTLHYTANVDSLTLAVSLGYNVLDIAGSTSNPASTKSTIDALPNGVQALVWVGNLDNAPVGSACPAPGFSLAQFQAQVDALASDSKVFGYFISDEAHPSVCPSAAVDIAARADYLHAHAPGQKAFIVVLDGSNACPGGIGCEYNALQPSHTHVDLIGLDPYPCHYSGTTPVACDLTKITTDVQTAEANGIAAAQIAPVFQTFGQEGRTDGGTMYYRTPTTTELTNMLSTWKGLVPNPVLDYAYSFGVQCSPSSCPAPQAISNHPELQTILQAHNAGN